MDSERGRPEADGAADRLFSPDGLEYAVVHEGQRAFVHRELGDVGLRRYECRRDRLAACDVHEAERPDQAGAYQHGGDV
ncbi:hypothetical protein D3C84_1225010 [compost metagenome]